MTTPSQRSLAVMEARALLTELLSQENASAVPSELRAAAARVLEHYPGSRELDLSSRVLPAVWGSPWVPDFDDEA